MAMRLELPRNVASVVKGRKWRRHHSIVLRGQRVKLQQFREGSRTPACCVGAALKLEDNSSNYKCCPCSAADRGHTVLARPYPECLDQNLHFGQHACELYSG